MSINYRSWKDPTKSANNPAVTCCWTSWSRTSAAWPAPRDNATGAIRSAWRAPGAQAQDLRFPHPDTQPTLANPPNSANALAVIGCELGERVNRDPTMRYRLVGVGLSGFVDADMLVAQSDLFTGD